MMPMTRRQALSLAAVVAAAGTIKPASGAKPQGQITIGVHVSLAPAWMDPAQTSGIITPYMLLYALHDAMAKDMPGLPQAPCLAESWSVAEDGLAYDFVLREGRAVPQWRTGHRRGCEILLRTLSWGVACS